MNEKTVVDTFDKDKLSLEFLAHVIDSAMACEPTDDDLSLRLDLAQAARALLDHYVEERHTAETIRLQSPAAAEMPVAPPSWVRDVIGKNGDGR